MKFSLILATVGKSEIMISLLESLKCQSVQSFELIVVDQNRDNRLIPILNSYQDSYEIKHIPSELGLSKARNIGIQVAEGDVFAFPDDDCWYRERILEQISNKFTSRPEVGGLCGRAVDENGVNIARYARHPGLVTKLNAWERCSSISLFLRNRAIRTVGCFDEQLGLGARTPWQSAEDIDLPIRLVTTGFQLRYDPEIVVYHPASLKDGAPQSCKRAYGYGVGVGFIWRKHNFPKWLVSYYLTRPLAGYIVSMAMLQPGKSRYYWSSFKGRWEGWRSVDGYPTNNS